jgi:DNA-binding protein YbaB
LFKPSTQSKLTYPTMKLSALVIASAAVATASAAKLGLRRSEDKSNLGETLDSRLVIHGLVKEVSNADMDIIADSIVSAYNDAFEPTGLTLETFNVHSTAELPSLTKCTHCPDDELTDKSPGALFLAQVSGLGKCTHCPDDDILEGMKGSQGNKYHTSFEKAFCDKLRQSGSANLAQANGCSFSYLDTPGLKVAVEVTEAQIIMDGTLHELSEDDVVIFEKSVKAAYNEAFKTAAGYAMNGVEVIADMDMVGKCTHCPDDELTDDKTLVLARVSHAVGKCTHCPDDDVEESVSESMISKMESAFEKSLCYKLESSGAANFANVHSCSFRFVGAQEE